MSFDGKVFSEQLERTANELEAKTKPKNYSLHSAIIILRLVSEAALRADYPEPHGNFEDTQDSNPEGGC